MNSPVTATVEKQVVFHSCQKLKGNCRREFAHFILPLCPFVTFSDTLAAVHTFFESAVYSFRWKKKTRNHRALQQRKGARAKVSLEVTEESKQTQTGCVMLIIIIIVIIIYCDVLLCFTEIFVSVRLVETRLWCLSSCRSKEQKCFESSQPL